MNYLGTALGAAGIVVIALLTASGVAAVDGGQAARFTLGDGRIVASGVDILVSTPEGHSFAVKSDRSGMGILGANGLDQQLPAGVSPTIKALSIDSDFLYFSEGNLIKVVDRVTAGVVREMPAPSTISMASLPSGRIAVGSPANSKRLHLYTKFGARLRSFGPWNNYSSYAAQNQFFNRGLVAAYKTQIAFAYNAALSSSIEIWNERGSLVRSFEVSSDTLVRQKAAAERILAALPSGTVGGQLLLTAVAFDSDTGNLWVAMNGGDGEVNLQEYARRGELLSEYSVVSPNDGHALALISSIVVRGHVLQVLSGQTVYEYRLPPRRFAALLGARLDRLVAKVMSISPVAVAHASPASRQMAPSQC